jgi:hypothetical protein
MFRFLKKWYASAVAGRAVRQRPSTRLGLESLEDRQLLSATAVSTVAVPDSAGHRSDYVFETTSDGELKLNRTDSTGSQWSLPGQPKPGVSVGAPSAVAYQYGPNQDQAWAVAFVTGSDGDLYMNVGGVLWKNLGKPPDPGTGPKLTITGDPGAVSYRDNSGHTIVDVFARGSDGHLWLAYNDGSKWQWADQGEDTGPVQSNPGVVAFRDAAGGERVAAVVKGADGALHIDVLQGTKPKWGDLQKPNGAVPEGTPSVVGFSGPSGFQIYAIVRGNNGHLYLVDCGGTHSPDKWKDLGQPDSAHNVQVAGDPSVATYALKDIPNHEMYAFVRGTDGHLYDVHFNDQTFIPEGWDTLGTPSGPGISGDPSVLTFQDSHGNQHMEVFAAGSDGHLYLHEGKTSGGPVLFPWHDQGLPPIDFSLVVSYWLLNRSYWWKHLK